MSRARDVADGALGTIAGTNGQVLTSNGTVWSSQPVATDLVNDTSPELGGNLTMGSHAIADGVMPVKNTGSAPSELRLYCESNNAHYVGLKSPAHSAFSGNHTITMPPNTGTSGQFLSTDGNGVTSWAAAGGGAWELLQTTKIPWNNTSTSLISFTNKFTTDYDVYQFVGASLQPTSFSGVLYLYSRLLNSSGTAINGNYGFINEYTNVNSGANGYRSHTNSNFTYMPLSFEGQKAGNGYSQSFILNVFDPLRNVDSNYVNFQSQGVTTNSSPFQVYTSDIRGWWFLDTSTQAHGLEFFFNSGNMTGQISLYGLKK